MSGVYVWLALADLRAAGACQEGMAEAESMARGQGREDKIRLRWDPLGSAWFWDAYPDYASWLAINGLIPPSATAGEGGTATAGDRGTATAGDRGTATAGYRGTATAGDYGTATAGDSGTATAGYRGTATAGEGGTATAGYRGTATAGYRGTATAGDRGTATAGEGGTATAGEGGEVHIRHYDGRRYRIAVGYVGEDGIDPGTAYVVTEGKLTRKVSP